MVGPAKRTATVELTVDELSAVIASLTASRDLVEKISGRFTHAFELLNDLRTRMLLVTAELTGEDVETLGLDS